MIKIDEFLAHYGVPGMKWGVRKARNEEARKAAFAKASPDAKKRIKVQERVNSKGTDAVSNKDLQDAITRMNLEVQYARLNEQTRKKSTGEKFIQMLIKDVAEPEVKRVVKMKTTQNVDKMMKAKTAQA